MPLQVSAAVHAQLTSLQQQRAAGMLSASMYISLAEELMGGSPSSGIPGIAADADGQ